MTCRKYRKLIVPWLDGELKPEQAAEMQAWFDSCPEVRQCSVCRKLADDYRSFHRFLQSTPQTEFPAFLHHRIMDQIKSREVVLHRRAVRTRWQLIPAAVAVLLSLYVGSLVGVRTFSAQNAKSKDTYAATSFGENGMVTTMYTIGDIE